MYKRRWSVSVIVAVIILVAVSCAADDPVVGSGQEASVGSVAEVCSAIDFDSNDEAESADHDDEGPTSAEVQMAFEIEMTEFAYGCELPDLVAGTVVALHFTNTGLVEHEAVVGDRAA